MCFQAAVFATIVPQFIAQLFLRISEIADASWIALAIRVAK
jgi:hypothetical protein